MKILVVDDELPFTNMFVDFLESEGYEAVKAFTGDQAKWLMKDKDFDLVIADVHMPDGTGIDLTKWIKNRNSNQNIFLISGNLELDQEEFRSLGIDKFYLKPIDFRELSSDLKTLQVSE